jgi:hypothetical protein
VKIDHRLQRKEKFIVRLFLSLFNGRVIVNELSHIKNYYMRSALVVLLKMSTKKKSKKKYFWLLVVFICAKIFLTLLAVTLTRTFYHHFHFSYVKSLLIGALTSFSLALLISFHKFSQCIFMLMIPQLLRKRGRIFLIGYAFFVAFSYPGKNIMKNAHELTDNLSCIQVSKMKFKIFLLIFLIKIRFK